LALEIAGSPNARSAHKTCEKWIIIDTALDLELPLISADVEIEETNYVELLWD